MSSLSNSNRRRSIAASSGLFRCAVMNSGEFRADSGKLRGGVFAPTRFDRYTGPPKFGLATSKDKGFGCAFAVALKNFTGWTTFTVFVLDTFFAQNCKTQIFFASLTTYAGSGRDALTVSANLKPKNKLLYLIQALSTTWALLQP